MWEVHLEHCAEGEEECGYVHRGKSECIGVDQVDYYQLRCVSKCAVDFVGGKDSLYIPFSGA